GAMKDEALSRWQAREGLIFSEDPDTGGGGPTARRPPSGPRGRGWGRGSPARGPPPAGRPWPGAPPRRESSRPWRASAFSWEGPCAPAPWSPGAAGRRVGGERG